MRVTESRMLEQAASAVSEARTRAARAGETMSSGKRVTRPSDDPSAWAQGARAAARQTMSAARGSTISRAVVNLAQTENVILTIGQNLSRASEVAVQAANGILTAADRAAFLPTLIGLREANISAANRMGADGEYLLSGSRGDLAPFDAAGNYLGDSVVRGVESAEGATTGATLPGSELTSANGVDVLKSLDALIAAMTANDVPGIQSASGTLNTSVAQMATSRAQIGARMSALDSADEARQDFELRLADTIATAVDADPVAAASELARSATALEGARAVAEQIVALVRNGR